MAQAGVTTTGLKEMRAAVERFPAAVTAKLRAVAWRISRLEMRRAAEILNSKTHGTGRTAALIYVIEEADRKQFVVVSHAPADKPENLPLWLEHGTVHMEPRSFMRPAAVEADIPYRTEMRQAADDVLRETFQ